MAATLQVRRMVALRAARHRLQGYVRTLAAHCPCRHQQYLAVRVVVQSCRSALFCFRCHWRGPASAVIFLVLVRVDVEAAPFLAAASAAQQHASVGQLFYLRLVALRCRARIGAA